MARPAVALLLVVTLLGLAVAASAFYETEKKLWVWPMPLQSSIGDSSSWLDEYTFIIRTTKSSYNHDILKEAFKRYKGLIAQNKGVRFSRNHSNPPNALFAQLRPHFHDDSII
jgi:hypothetical protein